jgi:NTE family protein
MKTKLKKRTLLEIIGCAIFCSLCAQPFVYSQNDKPKVALVLSGGGAKGVAHIPLLETLDSLGIIPDLIVGTSMGSAVGGLYAMGYTGDSIASIAINADWNKILSGEISLEDVGVEEKSEFGRYAVSLDLIKGKPKMKSGLLKDQNLREFLGAHIYPAYKIEHFDDLYIPFRAVATDLVAGKEVVLESGSLSNAIRSSISIPGVFQPVEYKGTLLVDGGVVNNFPTDVAKRLGADIIIGSDVSEGLLGPDKLDNVATILSQASMLTSGLKVEANRALCDVYLNHNPNLTHSTADFVKAPLIYEEGKVATKEQLEALSTLANYLKSFKPVKRRKLTFDPLTIDEIRFSGISQDNLAFVKARMNLKTNTSYTVEELKKAVDHAMGTEIFDQMTFKGEREEGKTIVEFTGFEKAASRISGSLHYNTYHGVGVVANYTGRNVLGRSSRFVFGVDIAEQPKLRIQYQKNIGESRNFWWNFQGYGENLEQNFFTQGQRGEVLKTRYRQLVGQLNRNLNPLKNYIGLDVAYNYTKARPALNPETNTNIYNLNQARFEALEVSAYYLSNSFNEVFFPTHGSMLTARVSRSIFSRANLQLQEYSGRSSSGDTNGFFRINLDFEKRFRISNNAFIINTTVGFTLEDDLRRDQLNLYEYGQVGFYQLGGYEQPNKRYAYAFKGMTNGELLTSQFARIYLAYQINPIGNFYATPYVNTSVVGFDGVNDFFSNLLSSGTDWAQADQTSLIYALGTTLSYRSILGPLHLDLAYLSGVEVLELYFGVGINLNIQR